MSAFRFLDLPDELRLKMYRFMLPRGERIHLDPDNLEFPIPYPHPETAEWYGSTSSLLRVCKKIHFEATEFIYRHNTVNIIATADAGNFLQDLGDTACEHLRKLECHVIEGLGDLGNIWETMTQCPLLTDLRLVFYHEAINWSKTLGQLAYYLKQREGACDYALDVEMHTSIWARHHSVVNYARQFYLHWERAKRHDKIRGYAFKLPSQLRHITIAASVNRVAAEGMVAWDSHTHMWRFRPVGNTDTDMKKTLRFQKMPED